MCVLVEMNQFNLQLISDLEYPLMIFSFSLLLWDVALQLGKVKEAADAATTVLASQPDNGVMLSNLQFYINELKIQPEDVLNLELKVGAFIIGGGEQEICRVRD